MDGPRHGRARAAVDEREGMIGLANLPPEQLVEIGLPVWWLMLQHGNPANVCLDGALVLRTAYAQFGITAVPKLVTLVVDDPDSDHATGYGTATPHFVRRGPVRRTHGLVAAAVLPVHRPQRPAVPRGPRRDLDYR